MTKASLLLVILLVAPAHAPGQSSEDSWDNLGQLRSGQRIEVVDMKMRSWRGAFTGFSEEAISLRIGPDETAVARADVFSVKNREGSRRGRNALIGLVIGAASGLAAGAIAGAAYHEEGETGVFVLVFTPIGAGAGAGLGAAMPTGAVTVYRAKSRGRP
jgi:hypothetical protein